MYLMMSLICAASFHFKYLKYTSYNQPVENSKKYRIVLYIEKELPIKVITQEYNDIYLC